MEDQKQIERSYSNNSDSDSDDESLTTEVFEKMLNKQRSTFIDYKKAMKWTDLKIGKIYTIRSYRKVKTMYGDSTLIKTWKGDVWCPKHLYDEIKGKNTPMFVRPLGLKQCKNNKNKFHDYDLVIPN